MKFLIQFFILAAGLFISGCSTIVNNSKIEDRAVTRASGSQSNETSPASSAAEMRAEAFARFATGISYELTDKSDLALDQFYRASLVDPANEDLALDLARRFLQLKKNGKAVEVLANSAKKPQATGNLFSWLSRAHLANGQTNLAINASQMAVKKSPQLISSYQILTEIFLQKGQIDEALKFLGRATQQTNTDAAFLIKLGELYGDVANAQPKTSEISKQRGLDSLTRATTLKPANPNLRQKLADNFAQLGDSNKASEIYLQLLSEFREVPLMRDTIREKLTNLYLRNSDKSKATEQLEAIVRDNPTRFPEAWYFLGTLANDATNYMKAAECFSRALVVNPEMEPAYYDLAGMQINLDQGGEALKTLEKARAKFSNNFTAEFLTGLAFSRMKNYADALKHLTAAEVIGNATSTNRLNHLFYFQIGATCERNQDYTQAEKYFEKCLEMEPEFSDALNYLGFMWADRGIKLKQARVLIEKAVKNEPDNAAYLDSFGWVLFKLNQHEPALEYLLKAAELSDEPDAAVYDHIGDVYRAMKQNKKACEAWRKSLAIEPSEAIQKKIQTHSSL